MDTRKQNRSIMRLYVLPIAVCILLALVIWLSVMRIGYTERFDDIPITVSGVDERFDLKASNTVSDVEFRGNRKSFSAVQKKDIRAYADLSALKEPGIYEVALTFSCPAAIELEEPIYFTVELVAQ